jgi:hypothetical protein
MDSKKREEQIEKNGKEEEGKMTDLATTVRAFMKAREVGHDLWRETCSAEGGKLSENMEYTMGLFDGALLSYMLANMLDGEGEEGAE